MGIVTCPTRPFLSEAPFLFQRDKLSFSAVPERRGKWEHGSDGTPSPSADVGKCRCTDVKGLSEEHCVRQLVCVSLASTGIAFMLTLPGREPPSPRCGGIRIESTLKRSTLRH